VFGLASPIQITSRIGANPGLVRHAEAAGSRVQGSLDDLVSKLSRGLNPGLGNNTVFGNVVEARARDGARVYFRTMADGSVEILAKSDKKNQASVIQRLRELYEQ
jgi:hypothetical protein